MNIDTSTVIVIAVICAGIGAAITNGKNRGLGEGVALGGLLGIIGVIIAACLKKKPPPAPEGMQVVTCPRCNAAQNVPVGQLQYQCCQCQLVTSP